MRIRDSSLLSALDFQAFTWSGVRRSVCHTSRKIQIIQKRAKRMIQSTKHLGRTEGTAGVCSTRGSMREKSSSTYKESFVITLWSLCLPDAGDAELYLSVVALKDNNACPCWWQTTLEGGTGGRLARGSVLPCTAADTGQMLSYSIGVWSHCSCTTIHK